MEVSPDFYAWLSSLKIINPFKNFTPNYSGKYYISKKTLELLNGGKYFDNILKNLQNAYNKFYKMNFDYLDNLNQMNNFDETQSYVSNSVKFNNWSIIKEILSHFGLKYEEDKISKIINGNIKIMMDIIINIYEYTNELLRHANLEKENYLKSEKLNENILNNKLTTNPNQKAGNEVIEVNKININKKYNECESPLEFFIISFCKNFKLKPIQSIGLLSNNRKFFANLCNKGINYSFNELKNWINDITFNLKILIELLKKYRDGKNIGYEIIGSCLFSKDLEIVLKSIDILINIKKEIGLNWKWFINEGLDSFFFTIIKHENQSLNLLNYLDDFVKDKLNDFFLELKSRKEKKNIYMFYSSILPIMEKINSKVFLKDLQNFLYDICLREKKDKSISISLLGNSFFYFYPIEEKIANIIIDHLKQSINSDHQNIFVSGVTQIFFLLEKFGESKIKYAPPLYKIMVNLFLENYNNLFKREFILLNFEKFFDDHQTVPIDIFLNSYFNLLVLSQNYSICDFYFLYKIFQHPRLNDFDLIVIIKFLLKISLQDLNYSRTSNLTLSLIFEKKMIQNKCDDNQIFELEKIFTEHIKNAINFFIKKINQIEDRSILETSYDILIQKIRNVNANVYNDIVKAISDYRKIKNKNSTVLLAMLWIYDDHDDVLLKLEESYKPTYK